VLALDPELETLRMLVDRRAELATQRTQTANRLQRLLAELTPGKAKKDITALQAKAILAGVRPRDVVGKTRRRLDAEQLVELVAVEKKLKVMSNELKSMVEASGSTLTEPPGSGRSSPPGCWPTSATSRGSLTGTGSRPGPARHRLSRAGNRWMNHVIHIAAISQIRLDTDGRAYYRRKRAEGKKSLEAIRCLKRRISDAIYRQLLADAEQAAGTGREGTAGRLKNPARSTCPRTSTLRISHFPDPRQPRYAEPVDNRREPK
jgi:transposase